MKRITGFVAILSVLVCGLFVIGKGEPSAQDSFPRKHITWIVPFGAGGGYDLTSRAVGKKMEEFLPGKGSIIFKNVKGAAGAIGAQNVYTAKPDGYTVGILNIPGHVINQKYGKVDYDLTKCSYIGNISVDDYGILVRKDSPYRSLKDLQASDGVRFGSTGVGDPNHVYPLIAAKEMGIKIKGFVFYKNAPEAIMGLIRGDVDAFSMAYLMYAAYERDTRALTIFSDKRWAKFPDVPTVAEQGYPQMVGLDLKRVVYGPPGIPEGILRTLEDAFWKAVTSDEVISWGEKANNPITGSTKGADARKIVMKTFDTFSSYDDLLRSEIR